MHQCDAQLKRRAQQIQEELVRGKYLLIYTLQVPHAEGTCSVFRVCLPPVPIDKQLGSLFWLLNRAGVKRSQ